MVGAFSWKMFILLSHSYKFISDPEQTLREKKDGTVILCCSMCDLSAKFKAAVRFRSGFQRSR